MDPWRAAYEASLAHVQRGDADGAVAHFRSQVKAAGESPFRAAVDFSFANPPEQVRAFVELRAADIARAVGGPSDLFTETNGFAFNTDRWHADVFGVDGPLTEFAIYGEFEDVGIYVDGTPLILTGGERMQAAFAAVRALDTDALKAADLDRAEAVATYLVHALYLKLINDAWNLGPIAGVAGPLAVTCHSMTPVLVLRPK